MVHHTSIPVWLLTILSVFAYTEGFLWLGGRKVSERSQQMPLPPQYLYRGEAAPWTPQYSYDSSVPQMAVAVPLAVQTSDDVVTIENPQLNPACDDIPKSPIPLQGPTASRGHFVKSSYPMTPMGAGLKGVAPPVQLVPCLCPITREEAQQQQQAQQSTSFVVQQQPSTAT